MTNNVIQEQYRFGALIGLMLISGFAQGMLMPVIAILFEHAGISSSVNGLHATGVYVGILFATPFMETLLRKFGYKRILMFGNLCIILPLLLFPLWKSFIFWFCLRLIIGIGISTLQFGSQTWITSFSPPNKRGRNISIFGLSFGLGFGLGPLMTRLLEVNEAFPFILTAVIGLIFWVSLFWLKNEYPDEMSNSSSLASSFKRFGQSWKYAWVAFLFPFTYGFLEATLNGNFPVYALKIGIDVNAVSIILPAFAIGSIVFQLPLGVMSDYFNRRKVLLSVMFLGATSFSIAGLLQESVIGLLICFFAAGMFVGSTYSLGVSYMVDLCPKYLLPTGNMLCSLLFSIGSITGPFIGGVSIQYLKGINFFYIISLILLGVFIALFFFKKQRETNENLMQSA